MSRFQVPIRHGAIWYSLLLFSAALLITRPTLGQQQIRFDRLSLEDGLSQATIQCIHQDKQGFLWFGTQDGLNKFDGYKFTIYRHQPGYPASLSNNYVLAISEDPSGYLWIGTYGGGLDRFDRKKGIFYHHVHEKENPASLSHDAAANGVSDIFCSIFLKKGLKEEPFSANDR